MRIKVNFFLVILMLFYGCSENSKIEGYYYDRFSPNIFLFEKNKFIEFDVVDSIKNIYKLNRLNKTIKFNNEVYTYSLKKDSLVLSNKLVDKKRTLILLDKDCLDINRNNKNDYLAEFDQKWNDTIDKIVVMLRFRNDSIFLYNRTIKNTEPLIYKYNGLSFSLFQLYRRGPLESFILIRASNDTLKTLYYNGYGESNVYNWTSSKEDNIAK